MRRVVHTRGFSLVEILVVIVIIGIVTSMAVLSLGTLGENRDLDTEVKRFASLMEVARDESMLQGREYGIEFLLQGYRFVELNPLTRQWDEIVGDDVLRLRQLPEHIEIELYIEDQQIELAFDPAVVDPDDEDGDAENFSPHVFVFSSGDLTPFEIHFRQAFSDNVVMLAANFLGDIEEIKEDEIP